MLTTDVLGATHAYDLTAPPMEPAETLVFIHGWLLSRAYWQPLVTQLSNKYQCLTYDLRGFGNSPPPLTEAPFPRTISLPAQCHKLLTEPFTASAYSLAAYAQDLGELLNQLGLDQVWLLGHSLGGSIALWAAYLLPEKIKGVICVNAGGGIYIPKAFEQFRAAGQQMVKFRPTWLPSVPLLPRVFSRMMVNQPLGPTWGKQRLKDFVRADRRAAVGSLLESTTQTEVHLLPRIVGEMAQPAHFITATQDTVMPPKYVRYLASFHPRFYQESLVSELADCGHMAMVEQSEAVAEVVQAVLTDTNPKKNP